MLMISGLPGVEGPRRFFFFVLAAGRVGLFLLVPRRFMVAVSCVFVGVGLGAGQLGGSCSSRWYRVSHGDGVDAASAQFFVNSSLAPVLLFRRRVKSVADVLKGIGQHGFTQGRWDALQQFWCAVCRQGPCGPVHTPGALGGVDSPDLHCFYRWAFDALELLNGWTRGCIDGLSGSGKT